MQEHKNLTHNRTARSNVCRDLDSVVRPYLDQFEDTTDIGSRKRKPILNVKKQQQSYYKERYLSALDPNGSCSIIVDGAEKSFIEILQFPYKTKDA